MGCMDSKAKGLIEGVARSLDEIRLENRRAIELGLHLYEETDLGRARSLFSKLVGVFERGLSGSIRGLEGTAAEVDGSQRERSSMIGARLFLHRRRGRT